MTLQIRIDGLEQVKGKLKQIPQLRKPVQVFLRSAGKLVRDIERGNIPKKTGRTAASVMYSVSTGSRGLFASVFFRARAKRGTKKKPSYEHVGRFLEKGTARHEQGPGSAFEKRMRAQGGHFKDYTRSGLFGGPMKKRVFYARQPGAGKRAIAFPGGAHPFARVKHPGQPARPFIQRTADQARGRVQALLGPLGETIKALWRG